MKHLLTLNRFFLKYKWRLLLGIFFVSLSNIFRVLQPQEIRHALDSVLNKLNLTPPEARGEAFIADMSSELMHFGFLILLYALLMGIFMYFMRQTIIVMSRMIEYDMRKEIFDHYLTLDQSFYKKNKTGDLMSRITEDVNKVRMYLGPAILYGINLVALAIIVIGTMFKVNFWLSVYTLLPLPILSYAIYWVSKRINMRSEVIQIQLAKMNTIAQEIYSGIRVVKSYAQEDKWSKRFETETAIYQKNQLSLTKIDAIFFPIMFLLIGLSTLITLYVGGLKVFEGSVTTGNIAEFVIYVNMLTWPVSSIGWIASLIQQAEASQKRINEFLHTESQLQELDTTTDLHINKPDITFEHVYFSYPDSEIQALKDVNFHIPYGSKIAIVGATASGKSSIAELLTRMYDVTQGTIKIGNHPVQQYKLQQLRNEIAYVPQDVFLFSDTIENNILFGSEDPDSVNYIELSEKSGLTEEIEKFNDGYKTMIGERGVSLSGGQKQRVSIARALAKNSKILILDDCLSAVDTETEGHIMDALFKDHSASSIILITHRLSKLYLLDKIIVIDHGKLVEQGTHEELLLQKGLYHSMFIMQNEEKGEELTA